MIYCASCQTMTDCIRLQSLDGRAGAFEVAAVAHGPKMLRRDPALSEHLAGHPDGTTDKERPRPHLSPGAAACRPASR